MNNGEWRRREPYTRLRFCPYFTVVRPYGPRVAIYSAQIYSLLICILTDPVESSVRHKAEYSASFVAVILAQDQGTRKV